MQQIPNFLLAAPVIALSFAASYSFYTHNPRAVISSTLPFLPNSLLPAANLKAKVAASPFLSPALTPFVHLHSALLVLLVFASHTQIILRLCSSDPVVWWYAAHLCSSGNGKERVWGRRWVKYCVMWGTVACALWAGFLPPA